MKATGIVRRIDDLGRIVIPKEIRRTLRIREGDPMEIYTDRENGIILKKYSPIGELGEFAGQYAESLAQTTGMMVCITDHDRVIAAAGGAKRDYLGKNISKKLEEAISEREQLQAIPEERKYMPITQEAQESAYAQTICPIISHGDSIGSVVMLAKEPKAKMGESEKKLAYCAASFLGRQMEQ